MRPMAPLWASLRHTVRSMTANDLSKNTILLTLSSLVTGFGTLIFWFVSAYLYPPNVVGVASAGTSAIFLLAGFSHLSLGMGIIRYTNSFGPQRTRRIATIFIAVAVIAAIVGGVYSAVFSKVGPELAPLFLTSQNIFLFVFSCAAYTLSLQYDSYLMSRRLFFLILVKNITIVIIRLTLLGIFPNLSIAKLVAIFGVSAAMGLLAILPVVARHPRHGLDDTEPAVSFGTILSFSLWNHLVGLATTTLPLALPTIVISTLDSTQAAAFYMSWSMFSVLLLLPVAFSTVVFVDQANRSSKAAEKEEPTQRQTDLIMIGLSLLAIPFIALALFLLGPTYFRYGVVVLLVLALGVLPNKRLTLLIAELRIIGSQRLLALACVVSQLMAVGGSIPLAHVLGTTGAACSWTLGQYLLFLWLMWLRRRVQVCNTD
jgi:O-antigen/teichoic acid export membrane protein